MEETELKLVKSGKALAAKEGLGMRGWEDAIRVMEKGFEDLEEKGKDIGEKGKVSSTEKGKIVGVEEAGQ